jgi:hypothetical protein
VKLYYVKMSVDRICIQEMSCLKSEAEQSKLFHSNKNDWIVRAERSVMGMISVSEFLFLW